MLKTYLICTMLLVLVCVPACKKDSAGNEAAPTAKPAPEKAKAPARAPAKAPEAAEPTEPDNPAELVPGKGITGLLIPGQKKTMDVMLGAKMMDIAGTLAMELGEHGTKVKRPIKLEASGFTFIGDGQGKLKTLAVTLQKVPGGLKVGEVTLTPDYELEWVKKELKGCKEEDGGKKLSCDEGKVVYTSDDKSQVIVTLSN